METPSPQHKMCEEGTEEEGRLRQLHKESLDGFINIEIFFF